MRSKANGGGALSALRARISSMSDKPRDRHRRRRPHGPRHAQASRQARPSGHRLRSRSEAMRRGARGRRGNRRDAGRARQGLRLRHHRRRLRRRGRGGGARRQRPARRDARRLDHRDLLDLRAGLRQGDRRARPRQGHRRARRADLPRPLGGGRGHAAGAGRRQARSGRAGAADLPVLLLRHRASRRGRPRPGRQGDEQPAALDQRHRPDRGRQARRVRPASICRSCAMRCR